MKRVITLTLLIAALSTLSFGQITLYKGIRSGLSGSELNDFLSSSQDFNKENLAGDMNYYTTTILGRPYILREGYNKYSELYVIDFISDSSYSSLNDENLRANVLELYHMLQGRYGDPVYDKWSELTYLDYDSQETIYIFGTSPDVGGIKIEREFGDSYSVILSFEDMSKELLDDSTSTSDDSDDYDDSDDWF